MDVVVGDRDDRVENRDNKRGVWRSLWPGVSTVKHLLLLARPSYQMYLTMNKRRKLTSIFFRYDLTLVIS